jgi:hypothetical protein
MPDWATHILSTAKDTDMRDSATHVLSTSEDNNMHSDILTYGNLSTAEDTQIIEKHVLSMAESDKCS